MTFAVDCETTGLDVYHGARPFFVSVCDDRGNQTFWEWDVDPRTREVRVPKTDVRELNALLVGKRETIVTHNGKFDVGMLRAAGVGYWPWDRTVDTLMAGHLVASTVRHDLTAMAVRYLDEDISRYEKNLEEAVKKCRSMVQQARLKIKRRSLPARKGKQGKGRVATAVRGLLADVTDAEREIASWRIAESDLPEMPSARDTTWRYDYWLPRAMRRAGFADGNPSWDTVLRDYGNIDSQVTVALWGVLEEEIRDRGLDSIFAERMKLLPVALGIETRGVTYSQEHKAKLTDEYAEVSARLGRVCVNIADGYDYNLELPKSGNNGSLLRFCFGESREDDHPLFPSKQQYLNLPVAARTENGNPSLGKEAIDIYLATLPPRSKQLTFVKAIAGKRARDTAIQYMRGYERYALPWVPAPGCVPDPDTGAGWYVLHPSLNPTGAATLRWSSSNPNEQNISKREGFNLRYIFGPAPGREWWSLDAKNIELRIPSYESGEQAFIDLFERPNDPPYFGSNHLLISHILHPKLFEECRDDSGNIDGRIFKKRYESTWYKWVKNGNFAVQYGAVDKDDGTGTADRAYHVKGAQAVIAKRFSKQDALNKYWIRYAEKHGYVETLPDRTCNPKRGYPVMCQRTEYGKIRPTVPLNYHIQSTACWVMSRSMVKVQGQLDQWNRGLPEHDRYYMIMQIHDELVLDFPLMEEKGNLPRVRVIQKLMESIGDDLVPAIPLPVGIEYNPVCWSEGETC